MKVLWLDKNIKYDGEQLKPLTNYLKHRVLGNSMVGWLGACDVTVEHMIDGEDLLAGASIKADEMAHFVLELFDFPLKAAVILQRLMAEMSAEVICGMSPQKPRFERRGDDLFFENKKLNISIATASSNSTLIHFAVNSKPTGAPVAICCLQDFGVDAREFSSAFMEKVRVEFEDIIEASQKVRSF